jgi:pimeloyl-ACP methyl ester carboxylesterase
VPLSPTRIYKFDYPSVNSQASFLLLSPEGNHPDKPAFVYLPGMDGTGELFCVQSPRLKRHFNIRCLSIPRDDLSPWQDMAAEVVALIRREYPNQPVYLCGESFGACLALHVIAHAPDIASHLVLINSASAFSRLPWLHWLSNLTTWIAPTFYRTSALGSLPILAALNRIHPDYHAVTLRAMRSVTQATAAWRLSLLSQFRLDALNLERFQGSVLIVASQADRLLPSVEEAHRLDEKFDRTQLHFLPYSGHISLLETEVNLSQILAEGGFLTPISSNREVAAIS